MTRPLYTTFKQTSKLIIFLNLFLLKREADDGGEDIKSEEEQTREQQKATLWRRVEMIKSSIENLSRASLNCK